MKKLSLNLFLFLAFAIVIFSCEENMPVVPDPPVITSERTVLVEEFTGVRCPNCPAGSKALEDLLGVYGDNLVVVSIHAGDFVNVLPESTIDFKTDDGENLLNYLGAPASYPSAVINRKDFDGGNYRLQYTLQKWAGFIDEEINVAPKITVNIERTYDQVTGELNVNVFGIAEEDITGELRLTVMITESNIVNAQDDASQGGIVTDYVHNHAFRKTLTKFDGDALSTGISQGDNYDIQLETFVVPDDWKPADCEIIAFVSLVDGQNKEVLQAAQKHLEE